MPNLAGIAARAVAGFMRPKTPKATSSYFHQSVDISPDKPKAQGATTPKQTPLQDGAGGAPNPPVSTKPVEVEKPSAPVQPTKSSPAAPTLSVDAQNQKPNPPARQAEPTFGVDPGPSVRPGFPYSRESKASKNKNLRAEQAKVQNKNVKPLNMATQISDFKSQNIISPTTPNAPVKQAESQPNHPVQPAASSAVQSTLNPMMNDQSVNARPTHFQTMSSKRLEAAYKPEDLDTGRDLEGHVEGYPKRLIPTEIPSKKEVDEFRAAYSASERDPEVAARLEGYKILEAQKRRAVRSALAGWRNKSVPKNFKG